MLWYPKVMPKPRFFAETVRSQNLDFTHRNWRFKMRPNVHRWITSGICIFTQLWSGCITGHNACSIVEITSCTSQVSDLISFLNSPSNLHWEAVFVVTRPAFIRVHWRGWGEYGSWRFR